MYLVLGIKTYKQYICNKNVVYNKILLYTLYNIFKLQTAKPEHTQTIFITVLIC